MSKRICVVGLDGVGLYNLRNVLDNLSLSSISTIISKGFMSSFISIPPYTPSAWTSIFTGVNPGKHGVYGFYRVYRDAGFRISLAVSRDVMYPRMFEITSMFNLKSVIVNVPLVFTPQGLVGHRNLTIVSDWASPKQFIYPKVLENRYREYLDEPPHRWVEAVDVKNYVKTVENFLEKRVDLYYELFDNVAPDLFIVIFSELDWLMHRVPDIARGKQLNLAYKILSLIDEFIRYVCSICDFVILVSDHGFTVSRLFVNVNRILANKNMIAFSYKLNINKLLHRQERVKVSHTNNDRRNFSYIPSLVLHNLLAFVEKIVPQHMLSKLESIVPISVEIDYSRSKAFMLESSNWGIYVRKGYLNMVKEIFSRIKLVKNIFHREEVFWGPYVDRAPDLILVPHNHVFFDTRICAETVYSGYLGEHEPHALIAFYGDGVLPSSSIGGEVKVSIYDLVPTILAYMGLPIPSNSDGKPLTEVFSIELLSAKKKTNYLHKFKILRKLKRN